MASAALASATGAPVITAHFPTKLAFLLEERARYKVLYGGRGGTKSWGIARALLIRMMKDPDLRVLCTREVQSSMKESVYQLLKDQIELLGLSPYFHVLKDEIRRIGGRGFFVFKGLADPEALKSAEGVDICWIEEARIVVKGSWLKLDPTVRKPGSEIWISYNPELEDDFLHDLFVIKEPPPRSIVRKMTYRDNPWLSPELREQMETMKVQNYDDYLWVWEGHCRTALDGAVYADELRSLQAEDRITRVPYLPGKPVHTFWDLGFADHTSIWFVQVVGFNYHVIDYYENNRKLIDHYIQALQNRGYVYGTDWLPHDAASNAPGVERTVERQLREAGRTVRITPNVSVADGINAARTIFPVSYFDAERCDQGIKRLRAYRYGLDERKGKWTRVPIHDQSSHAADAWRYVGVALKGDEAKPKKPASRVLNLREGGQSWMGT